MGLYRALGLGCGTRSLGRVQQTRPPKIGIQDSRVSKVQGLGLSV